MVFRQTFSASSCLSFIFPRIHSETCWFCRVRFPAPPACLLQIFLGMTRSLEPQNSNWLPAVTVCSDRILQIGVSPPPSLQGLPVSPGKVQSLCQPSTVAGSWGVCSQLKQASTLPPGFLSVSYGSWHSELKCPPLCTSKCHSSVAVCLFYNGIPSHSLHCYFVLFLSFFLFSVRKPDL